MRKYLEWRYDTIEATRARYPHSRYPHRIWPDLECNECYAAIDGPSDESWRPRDDLYQEPFKEKFEIIMRYMPELLKGVDYGA